MLAERDVAEDRAILQRRLNVVIPKMADRDDIIVTCLWHAEREPGMPKAPAWFTPATGHMTIDAGYALQGADPGAVNPLTPAGRRAHPVIIGLGCHESGHARATLWEPDFSADAAPAVRKAAVLLEEPRIEHRHLQHRPQDRPYLRAQSVLIDLSGFAPTAADGQALDRYRSAAAAIMILARVDAGVLEPDDAAPVEPVLRDCLGDDLDLLRDLWLEAIDLDDGDTDGLLDVARRWVEVLGEPPADLPEMGCGSPGAGGQGAPGEDEWDNPDDSSSGSGPDGDGDALAQALAEALANAGDGAADEIAAFDDNPPPSPQQAAKQAQEQADAAQDAKDKKAAARVFSGISPSANARPTGDVGPARKPTSEEQRLARHLGDVLRRARFREPDRSKRSAELPPGRMSGRAALLRTAQRSMGAPVTARPFTQTVHRVVPQPPVTIGFLSDGSGSMAPAAEVIASCMWAFSHAAYAVQGTSAAVVFGSRVQAVVAPGAPPPLVTTVLNNSGSHDFKGGLSALDGALNLSAGRGVRVLVVLSDQQFEPDQKAAVAPAVRRLTRRGVIVIWLNATPGTEIPTGAVEVKVPEVAQDDLDEVKAPGVAQKSRKPRGSRSSSALDMAAIPGLISQVFADAVRNA